jgi:hypothetical protein
MSKQFVFAATLVFCAVTFATAQNSGKRATPDASKRIAPVTRYELQPATLRTPEMMDAFDATMAISRDEKPEPAPRPTIDSALLAQFKQQATLDRTPRQSGGNAPQSPQAFKKFVGATECDGPGGCWVPPDVAGAIGPKNWVSVSNDMIEVHSRGGVVQKLNSLNGLMGYSTEALFDPTVQFDEEYQRWIVSADAFAESTTVQYQFFAVSLTSSATGSWYVYAVNTPGFTGTGSFWDYPHIGMTQDAVMITANVFGTQAFLGAYTFSMAKARIYNGFGLGVPVFGGLYATLQPPHQLLTDQNGFAWYAAAEPYLGAIEMYAMSYPANPNDTALYGPYNVTGATTLYPPGANQPSSCAPAGALLDSLDGRFQNAGTQNGDAYYQVHTTGETSVATPRYYIINGLLSFAPYISATNIFYAAGASNDFNPSIAADYLGDFALDWSSTNASAGIRASMYYADNKSGNPANIAGTNVFQSASCYNGVGTSRWGDYSQITLDPGTGPVSNVGTKVFWFTNETIPSLNFWSTEVANTPF